MPDPMLEALEVAREAGLLVPAQGGWKATAATDRHADVDLAVGGAGPARLLVLAPGNPAVTARVDGAAVRLTLAPQGAVWSAELAAVGPKAHVEVSGTAGVAALWIVRRAEEIPPPAPRDWQASDGGL